MIKSQSLILTFKAVGESLENIEHEPQDLNITINLSLNNDQAAINQLKLVNQDSWDMEAAFRYCTRQKDFGQVF